jgi:hypothetical protein
VAYALACRPVMVSPRTRSDYSGIDRACGKVVLAFKGWLKNFLGSIAPFENLCLAAEHDDLPRIDPACDLVDGPRHVRAGAACNDLLKALARPELDAEVEVLDPGR